MMKRFRSRLSTFRALWALTLLTLCSPVSAQTAGQFIPLFDDWLEATNGTLVCEDFESLVDLDGNPAADSLPPVEDRQPITRIPIANPQTIALGQISSNSDSFSNFALDREAGLDNFIEFFSSSDAPTPLVVDLDPDLCKLEGFHLSFGESALRISLFDGDVLVDTFDVDESNVFVGVGEVLFGWIAPEDLNVTRIEIDAIPFPGNVRSAAVLIELCATFLPCPEPPEPPTQTCFDQLDDVKAEVEALLATATDDDACLLQYALDCICWTQHDCFWVQPSGDRLTAYGGNVFLGNAYSILYLEHVSDPQADVIIDQLLATLECLVDREIEYAIANGGRQANIDKAMDFADLADVIDEEFDNQVIASLAFKLAWVNAYYATY
jgi:hypothetical protein